jgi:hypothetical protein
MNTINLNTVKYIFQIALVIIAIIFFVDKCSPDIPEPTTTTTIDIEQIKDSIKNVIVNSIEPIYIDTSKTTIKWLKPDKEIVKVTDTFYLNSDSTNLVSANKYSLTLESNKATADLDITTTGELLDIDGVINYPKETVTIKETIVNNAPHLSLYTMSPTNRFSPEIGLIYKTKGSLSFMLSGTYNELINQGELKVGAAITIFNKK